MTLVLNFSDNTPLQQLRQLGEWLKGIGLVNSFKIAPTVIEDEPDVDDFVDKMLVAAEVDVSSGSVYSTDEAKKELEKWLRERK